MTKINKEIKKRINLIIIIELKFLEIYGNHSLDRNLALE